MTLCLPAHRPAQDPGLLQVGADSRRGGDELHARRAGRPEVHRRAVPRPGVLQRAERRGRDADTRLADAAVLAGHGPRHQRGRREDHQERRHGHGKAGEVPGLLAPTSRAAFCLLLSSVGGIPVSTTHTKTSAIMGVGAVKRISAINFGVVRDMVLTWVFTFPGCGLISFLVAKVFIFFWGV